jgi:inner membrane protein
LIVISEGWYVITKQNDKLYFNDLRFGLLNDDREHPIFAFSYEIIDRNGEVSAEEVSKSKRDGILLLRRLVRRIAGN